MTPREMDHCIIRYGELVPCKTAFIDAHTPGSDQKENFTIIGGGVSEHPNQHVHILDTPGFNIGAAGQPPYCRNSLHVHSTAEVFRRPVCTVLRVVVQRLRPAIRHFVFSATCGMTLFSTVSPVYFVLAALVQPHITSARPVKSY